MQPGQAGHGRGLVAREAEATRGDDVAVHLARAAGDGVAWRRHRPAFELAAQRRILRARLDHPGHAGHPHPGYSHLALQLSPEDLRNGCLGVGHLTLALHLGHAVAKPAADFELQVTFRQFVAQLRPAEERRYGLDVIDESRARAPGHHYAVDGASLLVEGGGSRVPAPILLADEAIARYSNVFQEHSSEMLAAHHTNEGPTRHFGHAQIEHQVADAAVLRRVRLGPCEEDSSVRLSGAARRDLLAVYDTSVAIPDSASLE